MLTFSKLFDVMISKIIDKIDTTTRDIVGSIWNMNVRNEKQNMPNDAKNMN